MDFFIDFGSTEYLQKKMCRGTRVHRLCIVKSTLQEIKIDLQFKCAAAVLTSHLLLRSKIHLNCEF